VKSGTIFDDIIVTDSWEEAKAHAEKTFVANKAAEKDMFDAIEKERMESEKAASEAAAAAAGDSDASAEEEDHDEL